MVKTVWTKITQVYISIAGINGMCISCLNYAIFTYDISPPFSLNKLKSLMLYKYFK